MYCSFTVGVTSAGLPEICSCVLNGALGGLTSLAEDCNRWDDMSKGVEVSFKTLFFNLADDPDDCPVGSRRGPWCDLKSSISCWISDRWA